MCYLCTYVRSYVSVIKYKLVDITNCITIYGTVQLKFACDILHALNEAYLILHEQASPR